MFQQILRSPSGRVSHVSWTRHRENIQLFLVNRHQLNQTATGSLMHPVKPSTSQQGYARNAFRNFVSSPASVCQPAGSPGSNETGASTTKQGASISLLRDPNCNKDMAFSAEERDLLGLRGLLPPTVEPVALQHKRVLRQLQRYSSPLDKYVYLRGLLDRNETLFYSFLMANISAIMPIIYTPTVGEACLKFGHLFERPRGLYISLNDRGHIRRILDNWPSEQVKVIVVTDGERILGLGDLGTYGMGIPIGKLSLYTACAGIAPEACLPITIDVGTNTKTLLEDELYTGLRHPRVQGEQYDALLDEFMAAVAAKWGPNALVQFEDFGNSNAFRLLHKYQAQYCCFNDDIQGTASVTLAGLLAATRITKVPFNQNKFLFLGAGEAGTGIADLIVELLVRDGMARSEALSRCWFVDSKGLVIKSRLSTLQEHKVPYAHEHAPTTDLLAAVQSLRPTALLGVSAQPSAFTREVIEAMSSLNRRPIIFALSNPTSKCECTAHEAYEYSRGAAVFASGSPFDDVTISGTTYMSGQANNAYVFPAIGLGIIAANASRVPFSTFLVAAEALASQVTDSDLRSGCIFPPFADIRRLSLTIASAVARNALASAPCSPPLPPGVDIESHIRSLMYFPIYPTLLRSKL